MLHLLQNKREQYELMDDPNLVSPDKKERDTSNDLLDQPYSDAQTETYVSQTGEPTSITPLPTPLSLQKPKSHAGRWFLRGFVLLIIAALAAFGYWQWTETQSANNERASLQSELETVKAANKESVAQNDEDTEPVIKTTPEDEIEYEVGTLLAASDGVQYVFNAGSIVTKDKFATATASLPNSDAPAKLFVLEFVGADWIVLFTGEKGKVETAQKESLNKEYGVPVSIFDN